MRALVNFVVAFGVGALVALLAGCSYVCPAVNLRPILKANEACKAQASGSEDSRKACLDRWIMGEMTK